MKQRIGNIKSSKDVAITQASSSSTKSSSESQEVGEISDSERLQIKQIVGVDEVLLEALKMGASLTEKFAALPPEEAAALAQEIITLAEDGLEEKISLQQVSDSLIAVQEQRDIPGAIRQTFRDLAATISAASGSVVLWEMGDPTTVAIGVPALLGLSGLLAGDKLKDLYSRIFRRVRQKSEGTGDSE